MAACGPGSPGDDAGASGGAGSTGEAGSTSEAGSTDAVTTGSTGESWDEPPDCSMLELPGEPADLAQTPRADRDAEVLALGVEPALAVAPQARYEIVRADLEAIRAIDPPLADVHVEAWTDALAFWFWDYDFELMSAMHDLEYRAWDCHNGRYGAGIPRQIDGLAFMVTFDGIYGEAVRDAYAALPGLGEGVEVHLESSCFVTGCGKAGSITLTATLDAEGALDVRDYRFESTEGDVKVYRVTPGAAPVLL